MKILKINVAGKCLIHAYRLISGLTFTKQYTLEAIEAEEYVYYNAQENTLAKDMHCFNSDSSPSPSPFYSIDTLNNLLMIIYSTALYIIDIATVVSSVLVIQL